MIFYYFNVKQFQDIVTTGSGGYNFIKLDAGMSEVLSMMMT